ncbi:MAG: hypothetical protein M0Q53_02660 [Prolixibacteraceae bacterium]|nr:hypothetical protein [Prolixibacteraceae bacterium]
MNGKFQKVKGIEHLIDLYLKRKEEKEKVLLNFLSSEQPGFIIKQRGSFETFRNACNTTQKVFWNNMLDFEKNISNEWSDDLPFLEPWIGTGVYANAFGCELMWRENDAPDVHYKYHKIDEVANIEYPEYHKSSAMTMVLDCIDYFKEKTGEMLPISLTDTQSPFDTATLILDTTEFFTACYMAPEIIADFMSKITNLVIEFSKVQTERIGEKLLVRPGHLMPSSCSCGGISISDDNLAVSSPDINELFSFPCNQKIADAFNGLAIHSCGPWAHTMERLDKIRNITMIDCAITTANDPTPNRPSDVRDAMRNKGIIVKARFGNDMRKVLPLIEEIFDPSLKLIIEIIYDEEHAERNYHLIKEKLQKLYCNNS